MSALAIDGGSPVRPAPFPAWPVMSDEHISAVEAVVRSGRLNYWAGTQGGELEVEYAKHLGRAHAVAVANGTVAIELALRAFGLGAGDEVVVPARTFIATASAVVAVGATPVIADVDPISGNLTAKTATAALTDRTRALIAVHVGGWPADMDPINTLASERDLVVIEDCAQSHGGRYRGLPVGNLRSHAATFSFCQDKIIAVGDGGLLVLDDDEAYERAWSYKDHGKSRAKVAQAAAGHDATSFKWLIDGFGTNWRLDEMSAALARVGLAKLPEWHAARTANARALAGALADPGIAIDAPLPPEDVAHAFYRLYGYVDPSRLRPEWDRDRILRALASEGIPAHYGVCAEIYREGAFACAGLGPRERLPVARELHETAIAFHVHPALSQLEMAETADAVLKVMRVAQL